MLKSLSSLTTLFDFGPSIISEKIKDQMRSLQFQVKNMFASRYVPGAVGLPRFSVLEVAASDVSGDVVSAPSSTNWICKRVKVVSKKSAKEHLHVFTCVYIYTSVYGSTCDWRTNIPWFSWQVKYRLPCTVPSFLPLASSRMTPTHFPEANSVFPIYATVPRWPLPMTSTREPTLAGRPPPSELILLLPLLVVCGQEKKNLRRQKELLILSRKW